MSEVSVHLIYLLGLMGYSLLITGLFLSAYVANFKEKADHDLVSTHLRHQADHFAKLADGRLNRIKCLHAAQDKIDADLSTSHQHLQARESELDQARKDLAALKDYLRSSHPDAFADAQVNLAWQNSEHAFLTEDPQEAAHA